MKICRAVLAILSITLFIGTGCNNSTSTDTTNKDTTTVQQDTTRTNENNFSDPH